MKNIHKKAQEAQKDREFIKSEFKIVADQFSSLCDPNFVLFVPFCG